MIERYISHENMGKAGAVRKARILIDEQRYKVLKIEHTLVPMAGSTSTPYASSWGKYEPGYYITVETNGYEEGEKPIIPEIVERL